MKGKLINKYPKASVRTIENADGTTREVSVPSMRYVYEVTGSAEEIAKFIESGQASINQETGEPTLSDNGNPLYNTGRFEGVEFDAFISVNNKFVVEDSETKLAAQLTMEQTIAGNSEIAKALAAETAKQMLADAKAAAALLRKNRSGVSTPAQAKPDLG